MLLLPFSGGRLTGEVTGIFTTALPMLAHTALRVRWGTGDIGFQ
jgi:hypothetical protein